MNSWRQRSDAWLIVELGDTSLLPRSRLAYWDLTLIGLTGAPAVIIGVDHLLSMGFQSPVDRPAHSILFIFLSTALLAFAPKPLGAKNGLLARIAFAAPISILSHIACDIFAANELSWGWIQLSVAHPAKPQCV